MTGSYRYIPNPYLEKLDKIFGAQYKDTTPTALFLLPDTIGKVWMVTSLLSTPYILWLLFKLKKFGWIIFFFAFTIVPTWAGYKLIPNDLIRSLFVYIPILNTVLYHIFLKMTYPAWKEMMFTKVKKDPPIKLNL